MTDLLVDHCWRYGASGARTTWRRGLGLLAVVVTFFAPPAAAGIPPSDTSRAAGRCVVLPAVLQRLKARAIGPAVAHTYQVLMLRVVFAGETGNPVDMFGSSKLGPDETGALLMQVDDAFYENSAGLVRFAPTFAGVLTLPKTRDTYGAGFMELIADAKAVALAAGANAEAFDFTVVLAPWSPSFTYSGLCGGSWIHLNGAFLPCLLAHELGHSFGMGHSAAWAPNGSDPLGAGRRVEYGNPFDPMGTAQDLAQHFSAIWKAAAGWWPADAVMRTSASGTTRIYRHDHFRAAGTRALVVTPAPGVEYWLSVARNPCSLGFEFLAAPGNGVVIYRLDTKSPGLLLPELIRPTFDSTVDDFLEASFVPGMSLLDATNRVKFTVVAIGGVSPNEWADVSVEFNHAPGLAFSLEPTDMVLPADATLTLSTTTEVNATYRWRFNGATLPGQTAATLTITNAQASHSGAYRVEATAQGMTIRSREATVTVIQAPLITYDGPDQPVAEFETRNQTHHGFRSTARAQVSGAWYRDGVETQHFAYQADGGYTGAPGAEGAAANPNLTYFKSLMASGWMTPRQSSFYSYEETNSAGTATSIPLTIGLRSHKKIVGDAVEVGSDIRHPNGNIYDQLLMTGRAATFRADPGQITRCSFIDLTDDIVQVEFSGRGNLTINLDAFSGPAYPANYLQAVDYVRGHATIVIVGADETTNVSAFTVGRANAVNQGLFPAGQQYDGVADLKAIGIQSSDGRFGGVYAGNAEFSGTTGWVGINATRVTFTGPVRLSNISATGTAEPMLRMEAGGKIEIAGGDLSQANGRSIHLDGAITLKAIEGGTSCGGTLEAQPLRGAFRSDRR